MVALPIHVLEMLEELNLTGEQQRSIENLFNVMKADAIEKGNIFIDSERALEEAFQSGEIDEDVLNTLTLNSAKSRAKLRLVHLSAHLKMIGILNTDQIALYNNLRGYSTNDPCDNVPEGHDSVMWKKHNNCSE